MREAVLDVALGTFFLDLFGVCQALNLALQVLVLVLGGGKTLVLHLPHWSPLNGASLVPGGNGSRSPDTLFESGLQVAPAAVVRFRFTSKMPRSVSPVGWGGESHGKRDKGGPFRWLEAP